MGISKMNDREALCRQVWKKKPRGRPKHFTMELGERICFLASYGATDAEIAWFVGIGNSFKLVESFDETHKTPFNTVQNFVYCLFKKYPM